MRMLFVWLIAIQALSAQSFNLGCEETLQYWVDEFVIDAKAHGVEFTKEDLDAGLIEFESIEYFQDIIDDKYDGMGIIFGITFGASICSEGYHIQINEGWWDAISRRALIYHELGHGLLQLKHPDLVATAPFNWSFEYEDGNYLDIMYSRSNNHTIGRTKYYAPDNTDIEEVWDMAVDRLFTQKEDQFYWCDQTSKSTPPAIIK